MKLVAPRRMWDRVALWRRAESRRSPGATLIGQVTFTLGANVIVTVVSPLRTIILTRALSVEEYGTVSLFLISVSMLGYFLTLGFEQYLARQVPARDEQTKGTILKSVVACIVPIDLVLLSIAYLVASEWFGPYRMEFALVLLCAGLYSYSLVVGNYWYAERKLVFYNTIILLKNLPWILCLVIVLALPHETRMTAALLIFFVWLVVVAVVASWKVRHVITAARVSGQLIRAGFAFSVPLFPYLFGLWVVLWGDRYLLAYFSSNEAVALYSVPYGLLEIVYTVSISIASTVFPYFVTQWNKGQAAHNTGSSYSNAHARGRSVLRALGLKYSLTFMVPALVYIALLREPLIVLLAGAKYTASGSVIPYLILVPALQLLIYSSQQELLVRNRSGDVGLAYLGGVVTNLGLNALLIPAMGFYGSALAATCSFALIFVVIESRSRRYATMNYRSLRIERILLASLSTGLLLLGLSQYTNIILAAVLAAVCYPVILQAIGTLKGDFTRLQEVLSV